MAIEKLQKEKSDAQKLLTDTQALYDSKLAEKDAQLAAKDAEIDALKAKQLTDADIDAKVAQRAELIATAKAIHDADYNGKSDAEIKALAVSAKGVDIKDKPQAYVDASFDILAKDIKPKDTFADAMRGTVSAPVHMHDNGQSEYEKRIANAYKGGN